MYVFPASNGNKKRKAVSKAMEDTTVDEVVDIAKETSALARVTRGKDKIAIEGAASLMKKGKYDDLASYLDKMQEEPRQSVMMVMMNDQKIADKVMKILATTPCSDQWSCHVT